MRVLGRALRQQGEPIATPFPEIPITPGPGDVVEIIAAPGVGKSQYALTWATHLAKQGDPVLLMSTDTSYADQAVRTCAMLTGRRTEDIKANMDYWGDWLHEQTELPIRWSELHLDPDELDAFMKAEQEFLGRNPALVVVDVITDMLGSAEENVGNIRRIFRELKKIARRYRTTVLALHHVKRGQAANGTSRVTMQDGLYGGEQTVQQVLGLWRPGNDNLTVAVLKNRMGPMNGDGYLNFDLRVDYSRAMVASKQVLTW